MPRLDISIDSFDHATIACKLREIADLFDDDDHAPCLNEDSDGWFDMLDGLYTFDFYTD